MKVVLVILLEEVQVENLQEKNLVLQVEILQVVLVTQEEILLEVERVLLQGEQREGQVLVQIQDLILQ